MAFQLPSAEEVGGAQWPHDWYPYERYKAVHWRYMTILVDEGLIESDDLDIEEVRDGRRLRSVFIRGRINCRNGVMIQVDKELEVERTRSGSSASAGMRLLLSCLVE